ncbi:STAS domain-containing protein [Rhodococcus qingshengii]|uniref:STAS domain-containing protein n=1 Tax=Rhodococcus qingshengii TaxID=334542 RepID=UPI00352CFAB5
MLAYCFKPRLSTQPMRDLSVFLETRSSCVSFGGPFSFAECKPLRDGRTMTVVPGSSISGFTNAAKGSVDYGPPATGTATASFHAHRISAHTAVIKVRGEIDLMSANAFRDFLTYHVAADRTLVVDLSELEFMGTCGLRCCQSCRLDHATWAAHSRSSAPARCKGCSKQLVRSRCLPATSRSIMQSDSKRPDVSPLDHAVSVQAS